MLRFAIFVFLTLVPGATAATLVGHFSSDAAFNAYLSLIGLSGPSLNDYTNEVFEPQGRIGNNAAGGTYEIGLHKNVPSTTAPPTNAAPITPTSGSVDYRWGSSGNGNTPVDFTLTRVGNTVTFLFGSGPNYFYAASLTDPSTAQVNLIGFRTRSTSGPGTPKSSVSLSNLTLNGTAIGNSTAINGSTDYLVVRDLTGDFTITGKAAMDWNGTTPANSAMAFQIKSFIAPLSEVPEPSTTALLGAALVALVLVKRQARYFPESKEAAHRQN